MRHSKHIQGLKRTMNINKHVCYMFFCVIFVNVLLIVNYTIRVNRQSDRSISRIITSGERNSEIRAYMVNTRLWSNQSSGYGTCNLGAYDLKLDRKPVHFDYFTKNYSLDREPLRSTLSDSTAKRFCDNKIVSYDNKVVILHDVVMFPKERSDTGVIGGEKIINVLNQGEKKEHYQFKNGFMKVDCSDSVKLGKTEEQSNKWLESVQYHTNLTVNNVETVHDLVIAIERTDYANLYNWAVEVFNTYLMMVKFKFQPDEMSVLFLDAHPYSPLDNVWEEVFGPIQRIGHLKSPIMYKNLVFTFDEWRSPVANYTQKTFGEMEEYRTFVLSRNGVISQTKLTCPRIKITFIIRRDAVYHPRNTMGELQRKIFNEAELVEGLMKAFPHACVQAFMLETLPFYLQLEISSQTDLMIGMHGAGMSHVLFLPQHAAILELFPKGFKTGRPYFTIFRGFARWRGLKYDSGENFDSSMEMPHHYTILPVDIVVDKAKGLIDKLCKS